MGRHHICLVLVALAVAVAASACGGSAALTSHAASSANATSATAGAGRHRRAERRDRRRPRRGATTAPRPTAQARRLAVSGASARAVQAQPAAGSCHAMGSGRYSQPDPSCTPGALNPAVTPATIGQTICTRGWTETVRPAPDVTEPEKLASMAAYGDRGSADQ